MAQETVIVKVEIEGEDSLTKQEAVRLKLIQLTKERDALTKAFRTGNITEKEYAQGLTDVDNRQKRAQKTYNDMSRAVTGQRNVVNDLINSNKKLADSISGSGGIEGALKKGAAAVGAFFALDKIKQFAGSVIDITAEFQKFNAVLINTLGSRSAAQEAFNNIKQFASATPFSVVELTESFVKLANQGFKPTTEELRKLGDLASSQGKSFAMLTEAIIDAQTGEFERLKEFGIRASKEGDQVKFTFKGIQTQTDFTGESIRKYILSLGDLAGVSGGMAAISQTLGGKISNLGDNLDAILNTLGTKSSGLIGGFLDLVNAGLGGLNNALEDNVGNLRNEQAELNVLVGAITAANVPTEVRSNLITELNQKYPDFLKNLNVETVTNEQLSQRMEDVNAQFLKKIALQQAEERFQESQADVLDLIDDEIEARKRLESVRRGDVNFSESGGGGEGLTAEQKRLQEIARLNEIVTNSQIKRVEIQTQLSEKLIEYNKALDLFNTTNNDYFKGQEKATKEDEKKISKDQAAADLLYKQRKAREEFAKEEKEAREGRIQELSDFAEYETNIALDSANQKVNTEQELAQTLKGIQDTGDKGKKASIDFQIAEEMRLRDVLIQGTDFAANLFQKNKALSSAFTLASTYLSAQKAYESQFLPVPGPLSPVRGAIAAAIAVASGLARVAAINGLAFFNGGKVPGFAGGGLSGTRIMSHHGTPIQRSNGDNRLATVKTGEVILNERQQSALGGADTFRRIGVPGFAGGGLNEDVTRSSARVAMIEQNSSQSLLNAASRIRIVVYADDISAKQRVNEETTIKAQVL